MSVPATEEATFTLAISGDGLSLGLLENCITSLPGVACRSYSDGSVYVFSDGDATPNEAVTLTMRAYVVVAGKKNLDSTEGDPVMDFATTLTATVTGTDGTTGSGTSAPVSTRIVADPDEEAIIALATTAPPATRPSTTAVPPR